MQTSPIAVRKVERKPWVAGVLSVLLPGLGHLYLGRWVLGACWYATVLLLVLAFALVARSPLLPSIMNLGGVLIPLVGYFFVTRSAVRHARTVRPSYSLTAWDRWYVHLSLLLVGGSILSLIGGAGKDFVVQAYTIPGGSMVPTLLIGDQLYWDAKKDCRNYWFALRFFHLVALCPASAVPLLLTSVSIN